MKTLYLDCFSGASGDMMLGALLDAGADEQVLRDALHSMGINDEFTLLTPKSTKGGVAGCDVTVLVHSIPHMHNNEKLNHEHEHETRHEHPHNHDHQHDPAHVHGAQPDGHSYAGKRNLNDILILINRAKITETARNLAIEIFTKLGQAEADVHGVDISEVHFHEVGAVDSIVDIVGSAVCIDNLGAQRIISSPINVGFGMVKCAHGLFPVPAPATARLMKNAPMYTNSIKGELLTPTGAAIITTIAQEFGGIPSLTGTKIGYGYGKKETGALNCLRIFVGESESASEAVWQLEANIDDMTGEMLAYLAQRLMDNGALDAWCTPIIMKKGRPAVTVQALCHNDTIAQLEHVFLTESTTLGVRRVRYDRTILVRHVDEVHTPYGKIRMKVADSGSFTKASPEFEDCKAAALSSNVPLRTVMEAANRAYLA